MIDLERTRLIRNRLLATHRAMLGEYAALTERGADLDAVSLARHAAERVLARYYAALPRLSFGVCPYDNLPLIRSFDPFGLDGPWWTPTGATREPRACRHFCVVGGAVRFERRSPHGGDREVYPGPEVPYVYPRLLSTAGMTAVIATLPMDFGLQAFTISYFAERRPPGEQLVGGWKATMHEWTTSLGETGFRVENDEWDFALEPWLMRGKLRWCKPASDNLVLQTIKDSCPYVDLPGDRKYQVVQQNQVGFMALPDGEPIDPYDP